VPRRIEVFDNSHISGTNAVGAMIVAGPEGFVKGQYRKFNIKDPDTEPGDDYAMMREVLTRRFKKIEPVVIPDAERPAPLRDAAGPLSGSASREQGLEALKEESAGHGSRLPQEGSSGMTMSCEDDGDDDAQQLAEEFPSRPDIVFVDGGLGQLSVAREVMAALGITDIQLIGVAKGPDRDAGREHFHMPGRERPIMLEAKDPVLYFVQRLRDEAHRFAIGTHRAKRSKALGVNRLDEVDGIGPTRKRALLTHFGSAKAVSRAGIEDLKAVAGISAEMAQKIYDFFHDRP
ncbi:MAG: helix-hairpin-helix domain-containing protein, partial [Hyphomicrobium sp.]